LQLITEELGTTDDVQSAEVSETLSADAFGSFAVLQASDDEFVQAGNNWNASEECAAFLRRHGSDPWQLEYRDPESGTLLRAAGDQTLARVTEVFLAFLAGDRSWRSSFKWSEVEL
jgi:hypothetical protein